MSRLEKANLDSILQNRHGQCFVCGAFLPNSRRRHKRTYCSNACRQWDYRYRHASERRAARMVDLLKRSIKRAQQGVTV